MPIKRSRAEREEPFYEGRPFLDSYIADRIDRASRDPAGSVGGLWEKMPRVQRDILLAEGDR